MRKVRIRNEKHPYEKIFDSLNEEKFEIHLDMEMMEKASVDLWLKDIAPSTGLRKWFNHDPEKWNEFKKRYLAELNENKKSVAMLKEQLTNGVVTLIFGAKDEEHNEALVLKELFNR